jgi:signal transduction histidine kinase
MAEHDTETPGQMSPHEQQSHVRHELRAPLAVMYPVLSMLLDGTAGELTATQREYLEILDRNVVRLEGMIASFADSGWLDCAAAPPAAARVPLPGLVGDVLAARRQRWADGPRIETRFATDAPPAVVDSEDARKIVANLLENAVRYTPASGRVTVAVAEGADRGTVELTVADTGAGIAVADLEHVFEFGFRGAAALAGSVPGLGLGLWVSRELAERNGGSVTLESRPGAGARAAVVLPA